MINVTVFKLGGTLFEKPETLKQIPARAFEFVQTPKTLFVCSALAGVTKELILISDLAKAGGENKNKRDKLFKDLKQKHLDLGHSVLQSHRLQLFDHEIEKIFSELKKDLIVRPNYPGKIIGYGEIISSLVFSMLLDDNHKENFCFDARECIKTKNGPTVFADLNIQKSISAVNYRIPSKFSNSDTLVTQGFIGQRDHDLMSSVLSLNGSDLSAALFATALNARQIVYLKDVPGVLKDPKGDWDDPSNIYFDMSYSDYSKIFKGKKEYPVYPAAIELLATAKIPTKVCTFFNTFKGSGTNIID